MQGLQLVEILPKTFFSFGKNVSLPVPSSDNALTLLLVYFLEARAIFLENLY